MKAPSLVDVATNPATLPPQPRAQPPHIAGTFALALANAREEEGGEATFGGSTPLTGMPFAQQALTTLPPPADMLDPAAAQQLERIAAAIAEVRVAGGDPQVHISWSPGPLPLDGALVSREPGGGLSVVLLGQIGVPPAVAARMAGDLRHHLAQHAIPAKVRVQRDLPTRSARSIS